MDSSLLISVNHILPGTQVFNGMQVILDRGMVHQIGEDWSDCRSPSRAKRRRRQGHPQRMRPVLAPDEEIMQIFGTLKMHPAIWEKLKMMNAKADRLQ